MRYVDNEAMLTLLRESQNRVKSIALIHEKLYLTPDLAKIDFAEYIQSLTRQLFQAYSTPSKTIALILNLERACQAIIDLAAHVVRRDKLGIPKFSRELFDLLFQNKIIPHE